MDDPAKKAISPGLIAAAIGFVVFCFFSPTIGYDFLHSDDDVNVFENEHIRSLNWESLRWMFTDFQQAIRFKPLSWLGWAVIYQFSGLNPLGYHLANVILHALNGALLFLVLLTMSNGERSRGMLVAGLIALLWSLHPLRVEPVAWVTGFPYHLTTVFLLLSVMAYQRVNAGASAFRQQMFWLSVGLYVLAIATYPIALGFVCVLLALDAIRLQGKAMEVSAETKRLVVEKIPYVVVAVGVAGLTVMSRYQVDSAWGSASTAAEYDYVRHAMQACYVWTYYLWKPLFVFHQTAIPMDLIENETLSPPFLLSLVVVLAVSGLALKSVRTRIGVIAFWTAHAGLLVPLLGLTEDYHFPSDRYATLPSLVMAAAVFLLMFKAVDSKRVKVLGAIALAVFAGQSIRYLPVWEDDVTYFGYLSLRLEQNIMRPAIRERLGDAHARRENPSDAIAAYAGAIEGASPYSSSETYYKLAVLLESVGRYQDAEAVLIEGMPRLPRHPGAMFVMAKILAAQGKPDLAKQMLQVVLMLEPDFPEALELQRKWSDE